MTGLGHFGLGFAAKRLIPEVPIWILLLCSWWLDFTYIVLSLFGIDTVDGYITHSLVMAAVWSLLWFTGTYIVSKKLRTSIFLGLLVFSHWALDFITWPMKAIYPDYIGMPLCFENSSRFGLGLYKTLAGVIIGEMILFTGGLLIYIFTLLKIKKRINYWRINHSKLTEGL